MGICNYNCFTHIDNSQDSIIQLITHKTGPELNKIQLLFTNSPLHLLQSQCVVFFAEKCSQLYASKLTKTIDERLKKKIFEYLQLAEKYIKENHLEYCLMPIAIPKFSYKFILLAKVQPWEAINSEQIQRNLLTLTIRCFALLKQKKIKNFTISEIDQFIGIPSGICCNIFSKALKKYHLDSYTIIFMCKDIDSVQFYHKNIKQLKGNEANSKSFDNIQVDQVSNYF